MAMLRATVLLLVIALLAGKAAALEDYSGPNGDPVQTYAYASSFGTTYCPGLLASGGWTNLMGCLTEWSLAAGEGWTAQWAINAAANNATGCSSTGTGPPTGLPVGVTQVRLCAFDEGVYMPANGGVFATISVGCDTALYDLANIAGVARCVSKCYSLRGTEVSLFIPIDSPDQVLTQACFFIAGKGSCEVEVVTASNYSYGSQLYRAGTFAHVGQRCTEDASSAPTTGAVSNAPTGGTGSGTGSEDNSATKNAMDSAIASSQAAASSSLESAKVAIEAGPYPTMTPTEGRWTFGLTGFLPAAETCELTAGNLPRTTAAALPFTISICTWAPYARDFLQWAFALFTAFGIWMIVFSPKGT